MQSLWVGTRLSTMEQLSIRSYLDQGHDFHLFTYGSVEGVPAGASVRSGEEVLPAADIFRYRRGRGRGSVSAFSNRFRYRLLLDRGGWWSDLDSVCLKPLEFAEEHVFGYERSPDGGTLVGTGLFKAPAGSRLMEYCWHATREVDRSRLEWGEIGPRLMTRAVEAVGVPVRIMAPGVFFPIDFWRVWQLVLDRQDSGRLPCDPPLELGVEAQLAAPRCRVPPGLHLRATQTQVRRRFPALARREVRVGEVARCAGCDS